MSLSTFMRRWRAFPHPPPPPPPRAATVGGVMTRDPVCISPDMTLARVIDGVILGRGCGVLPVVEDGVLLGRLDRRMVAAIDREHWASTRANDVFVETRADHVLSAPMRLAEVFTLITETGQHKFLVTQEEGRLVGVVTLSDLTEYLSPP